MSRKKISTTIYVTPEQSERLRLLHERTKVPVAVYIREGIDLVLRQYGHLLPGQLPLAADVDADARRADKPAARGRRRTRSSGEPAERQPSGPARSAAAPASATPSTDCPDADPAVSHPQLLDHRPHRPRQIDAGRPHPRGHRRAHRARDARAVPRQDGHRARARDHHQGADRPPHVHRRRRRRPTSSTSSTRRATSTSTTRSRAASPRARARSSSSTRRRGSRRRRSRTSTSRSTRASRSCRCSTRSTCRASDVEGTKAQIEQVVGLDCSEAISASGKTGVGVREILEQIVAEGPAAEGQGRRAAARPHLRLLVRQYRGAVVDGPRRRRHAQEGRQDPLPGDGDATTRSPSWACFQPFAVALEELGAGRGRLHRRRTSRASTTRSSATR